MFGNFFTSAINYFRGVQNTNLTSDYDPGPNVNKQGDYGSGPSPIGVGGMDYPEMKETHSEDFDWKGFGQMGVQAMGNAYKANQANKQAPQQAPAIGFSGGQNAAQGAAAQRIQQLTQFDKQAGRFSKEMPRF